MLVRDKMLQELHYSQKEADQIAQQLEQLQPQLRPLLNAWLEEGVDTDDTLWHGYSIDSLRKDFGLEFTGALLTLDWIEREPETAIKLLKKGVK